jgi:hypothetical protein
LLAARARISLTLVCDQGWRVLPAQFAIAFCLEQVAKHLCKGFIPIGRLLLQRFANNPAQLLQRRGISVSGKSGVGARSRIATIVSALVVPANGRSPANIS